MKKLYIAALGAFGAALAFPLAAQSLPLGVAAPAVGQLSAKNSNLIEVQQRVFQGGRGVNRGGRAFGGGRAFKSGRAFNRGGVNRSGIAGVNRGGLGGRPGVRNQRFINRGGYAYSGGYRGYRNARPGYRYSNGWWFPGAALATGAILGGIIANQSYYDAPQTVYGGDDLTSQHYSWCQQRYISYRAGDNSFQPYQGPRQACVSPYS
jgi:hypothetical protein